MSRVRYGSRRADALSRRRVLAIAATAGVGVSVAGVAGISLAGETSAKDDGQPLVISLRDAAKGEFDIFSGGSRSTFTDKKLAAKLLKSVKR
jgi:hypothetical protein